MAGKLSVAIVLLLGIYQVQAQSNPSILQDSRNEPKTDGTFGFLYRTEDGIAHAAKADPGGVVHGRFTYTDPTGLKVNYNYNAGSSVTPKYNYDAQPQRPQYQQQPQQDYQQPQQRYQPQPQPQRQPQPQQQYQQPQYQPRRQQQQYEQAEDNYYQPQPQQPVYKPRTRPPSPTNYDANNYNDVNNNYDNNGYDNNGFDNNQQFF